MTALGVILSIIINNGGCVRSHARTRKVIVNDELITLLYFRIILTQFCSRLSSLKLHCLPCVFAVEICEVFLQQKLVFLQHHLCWPAMHLNQQLRYKTYWLQMNMTLSLDHVFIEDILAAHHFHVSNGPTVAHQSYQPSD